MITNRVSSMCHTQDFATIKQEYACAIDEGCISSANLNDDSQGNITVLSSNPKMKPTTQIPQAVMADQNSSCDSNPQHFTISVIQCFLDEFAFNNPQHASKIDDIRSFQIRAFGQFAVSQDVVQFFLDELAFNNPQYASKIDDIRSLQICTFAQLYCACITNSIPVRYSALGNLSENIIVQKEMNQQIMTRKNRNRSQKNRSQTWCDYNGITSIEITENFRYCMISKSVFQFLLNDLLDSLASNNLECALTIS